MDDSTCGQVKAGFRTVDLGIAYTKGITFDDEGEAIVMPGFMYGEKFSRLEPFVVHTPNQQHGESLDSDARELPNPRPSSIVGDQSDLSMTTTEARHLSTGLPDKETYTLRHSSIDAGADTQDKEDLSRLKALVSSDAPTLCCALLTYPRNLLSHIRRMTPN